MASRPALLAAPFRAVGRAGHLRRAARPPGGRDEPGRCPALDPLARPGHSWAAGGRQRFLHGLPLPAAADRGAPLAAGALELAASAAEQVAGCAADCRVPVGLRGTGPVGPTMVDGVRR